MAGSGSRGTATPSRRRVAALALALALAAPHGAAPAVDAGPPPAARSARFSAPDGCRNLTLLEYPAAGFPRVLPLTRFCPFEPRTDCFTETVPQRSRLALRENPRSRRRDTIQWKLKKGQAAAPTDLGDPTADTDYELCVYVSVADVCWLVLHPDALAGEGWKARRKGFAYKAKRGVHPEGLRKLRLRPGVDGKTRIVLRGKGDLLELRALPIPEGASVLVQLYNGLDRCWSTEFGQTPVRSDGRRFRDRSD
jgi:hypothetical protein